jgi:hypothetical protein
VHTIYSPGRFITSMSTEAEAPIVSAEPLAPTDARTMAAAPAAFELTLSGAPAASDAATGVAPLATSTGLAPSVAAADSANLSAPPIAIGVLVGSGGGGAPVGSGSIPVVNAGPVVAGRGTGASAVARPASAPPLRVIAEILRDQLDVKGNVAEVVRGAVETLGLQLAEGMSLMAQARACHVALCGDRSVPEDASLGPSSSATVRQRPSRPGSARRQPPVIVQGAGPYVPVLRCRGVEFGFQYYNFYGDWTMDTELPLCNGRPHYTHHTMYGGRAHLFHCIDQHYHVPRWVLGPSPGNENGWAFCESDAPTPYEVTATWISWDGHEWHSSRALRFVEPPDANADDDESDYEEENELESRFVNESGLATAAGEEGSAQDSAAADETGAQRGASGAPRAASTSLGAPSASARAAGGGAAGSAQPPRSAGGASSSFCTVM